MTAPVTIVFLAGMLPILAAHLAYLLNIWAGADLASQYVCMPYLDGCVSISRAARSGPGLHLFRALMLPSAVLLLLSWEFVREWLRGLGACSGRRGWLIGGLGAVGAVFLVFYATWLGTEGDWYRWLRRYGVIFYFAGTALARRARRIGDGRRVDDGVETEADVGPDPHQPHRVDALDGQQTRVEVTPAGGGRQHGDDGVARPVERDQYRFAVAESQRHLFAAPGPALAEAELDGRGIAAIEGKKVFVAGALPGEEVRFQRRKFRRNYDEAELLEVLAASPERIEARCAVFGRCGGCSLQHISESQQREIKQRALQDNFERRGLSGEWGAKADRFADIKLQGDVRLVFTPFAGKMGVFGKLFFAYDFFAFAGFGFEPQQLPAPGQRFPLGSLADNKWYPLRAGENERYLERLDPALARAVNDRAGDLVERFVHVSMAVHDIEDSLTLVALMGGEFRAGGLVPAHVVTLPAVHGYRDLGHRAQRRQLRGERHARHGLLVGPVRDGAR